MRKLLVSVAIATATLAAVPAAAQYQGSGWSQRGDNHRGYDQRGVGQLFRELAQTEQRIERSARRGIISPREAVSLRREANQIRRQLHVASRNGLNRREFAQLNFRVDRLEQRVRIERRDRDGWRG